MTKRLIQGNQAIALAAVKAGLSFYAGYPITPASEVLHELVNKKTVRVLQMEDEIASINAIIGSSLAGAKSMTATSGPGFSLMQESIGLAHMMEIPLVIVNVQRVGPSTGMPTFPAQGDILQCKYGSHGDYFPIVFYPNSVAELYEFTFNAFNAAEESLSPVILLSDSYVGHLYETIEEIDYPISKRTLAPLGTSNRHFTGLTHADSKPVTSDPEVHKKLIKRLEAKQKKVSRKYNDYEYIENKNSDTLLIAYGAMSRVAYEFKEDFAIYRPVRIFPIVEKIKDIAKKYKQIVIMEMNTGQYANEVERLLHREVKLIPILGGKIDLKEIASKLRRIKKKK
ncbi:MAG: 2-oxoacid:acceptor oxidoreductase subunit alpha [Candidatus Scalindua sp.]|jgi:2-oxoglutarate ferredoxin oxidoreductase subunit alpha|nr:2-oxoacid:acceptor oxidoreductase subunit alpha [Candidatus Scalindua sp.]MBT5305393.1 2-oxoacid:acceptor oxidoreductase subunit alpha [Candidatus Scalindua sp.]MBT6051757.1 2-oxoacid:acceptor oxidoreductase subunit alpha [Candidatus Scalindua sp.]MBT6225603.1 2-oxoacid:acceptor oxidoreductase subunit alpha [Candidatus Scalindua sp.]MBT6560956.1 2-oxoacid:acceptor oxidoreductase subunit alpha [Candidatus Scalindua sp.]